MILTEIYLPSIEKTFDFQLDEKMTVEETTKEVLSVISASEHIELPEDLTGYVMCFMDREKLLPGNEYLYKCGVKSGSRLMIL